MVVLMSIKNYWGITCCNVYLNDIFAGDKKSYWGAGIMKSPLSVTDISQVRNVIGFFSKKINQLYIFCHFGFISKFFFLTYRSRYIPNAIFLYFSICSLIILYPYSRVLNTLFYYVLSVMKLISFCLAILINVNWKPKFNFMLSFIQILLLCRKVIENKLCTHIL